MNKLIIASIAITIPFAAALAARFNLAIKGNQIALALTNLFIILQAIKVLNFGECIILSATAIIAHSWLRRQTDESSWKQVLQATELEEKSSVQEKITPIIQAVGEPEKKIFVAGKLFGISTMNVWLKGRKKGTLTLSYSDYLILKNENSTEIENEESLALIAHELAHSERHVETVLALNTIELILINIINATLIMFAPTIIGLNPYCIGWFSMLIAFVLIQSKGYCNLASRYISRKNELEADQGLFKFKEKDLRKGFIRYLIKTHNFYKDEKSSLISTHPCDKERAEALGLDYEEIYSELYNEKFGSKA